MSVEIEYKQFSDADEQRIRAIVGIGKQKGRFLKETEAATTVTEEHEQQIAGALNVDLTTAHQLGKMVNKNWPAHGSAHIGIDGHAESVVVYYFGNKKPKEIAGIVAHEMGHVADYDDTYELTEDDLRRDSFMRELVAVRHSEGKRGFEHLYTRQVQKLRELHDTISAKYPAKLAKLGGKSFDELWIIAGDAVERQRAARTSVPAKRPVSRSRVRDRDASGTQVRGISRR